MAFTDFLGLITGGLSGLFQLGSNSMSYSNQRAMQSNEYIYNRKLMDYNAELSRNQLDYNIKRNLEYYGPEAQLSRLYDANINPLSQFGGDFGSSPNPSGASSSMGSVGSPSATPFVNPLSEAVQTAVAMSQAKLNSATAGKTESETAKINLETQLMPDMTDSQISYYASLATKALKDGNVSDKQLEVMDANIKSIEQNIKNSQNEISMSIADNIRQEIYLKIAKDRNDWERNLAEVGAATDRFNAETSRINAFTGQSQLQLDKERFDVYSKEVEGKLKQIDNDIDISKSRWAENLRQGRLDEFQKLFDVSSIGVFGSKFSTPSKLAEVIGAFSAFNAMYNDGKISREDYVKTLPDVVTFYQRIKHTFGSDAESGSFIDKLRSMLYEGQNDPGYSSSTDPFFGGSPESPQ